MVVISDFSVLLFTVLQSTLSPGKLSKLRVCRMLPFTSSTLIQSSQAKSKGTFYRLLVREASVDPCCQFVSPSKKKPSPFGCEDPALSQAQLAQQFLTAASRRSQRHAAQHRCSRFSPTFLHMLRFFNWFWLRHVHHPLAVQPPRMRVSTCPPLEMCEPRAASVSPRSPTRLVGSTRIQKQTFCPQDLSSFLSGDHAFTLLPPTVAGTAVLALRGLGIKTRHCVPLHWWASEADSGLSGLSRKGHSSGKPSSLPCPDTQRCPPHSRRWMNKWVNELINYIPGT